MISFVYTNTAFILPINVLDRKLNNGPDNIKGIILKCTITYDYLVDLASCDSHRGRNIYIYEKYTS